MFSIDQNCNSLWDALPKLQALVRKGKSVRHFVEDIDVAFTSIGSGGGAEQLRLAHERYHHSGAADWGAAMFYSEFLGRLPVDVRDWEPLTGLKTSALARQLGRSVEDLFDEFSPSDNWQLVGPSYVGDRRHHRVIGDLTVAETAGLLVRLMDKAAEDMLRAFPSPDAHGRLREWFARERGRLDRWLAEHAGGKLVDLYRTWLAEYLGGAVELDLTSNLFACRAGAGRTELLEVFLADYDLAAGLYNEAVAETDTRLRPLNTADGELPFFAALDRQGHFVRTGVSLRSGELVIAERAFPLGGGNRPPLEALAEAGIRCLAGKAVVLAIQVRLGDTGRPLALPYRGSQYMPASHRLAEKLTAAGLLPAAPRPIVRVRVRLLERMRSVDTTIRLPEHLAAAFGRDEISTRQFAEAHQALSAEAASRLESLKTPEGRRQWQARCFGELVAELAELDRRRRELARTDPAPEKIRPLSHRARALQAELLDRGLRQIARDYQLSRIDYWDSRGAICPWAVALGGEGFYNDLIQRAEVYEEPHPEP